MWLSTPPMKVMKPTDAAGIDAKMKAAPAIITAVMTASAICSGAPHLLEEE
jgi:hypothetical protein